jgi:hypothetical protein
MRIARSSTFALLTLALASFVHCGKDRASTTTVTSGVATPDPDETRRRLDYAHAARADMNNLEKRIHRLEIYARSLPDGTDAARLEDDLREARAGFRALLLRVDAVATMSNETWKNEHPRLDADWQKLNARVDEVSAALTHELFSP